MSEVIRGGAQAQTEATDPSPKFTAGPWKVYRGRSKDGNARFVGIGQSETGEGVTDPTFGLWGSGEEREANAHLIASAPDLYAALKQLRREVSAAGFDDAKDYGWPKAIADADAALRKAEGAE